MISSLIFNLEKKFEKIGAKVSVVFVSDRRPGRWRAWQQSVPVRVNIITKKGKEQFELAIGKNLADKLADNLDLTVLEVLPKERHLVLLAKQTDRQGNVVSKDHFLCGHDERHFFVASVQAVGFLD